MPPMGPAVDLLAGDSPVSVLGLSPVGLFVDILLPDGCETYDCSPALFGLLFSSLDLVGNLLAISTTWSLGSSYPAAA